MDQQEVDLANKIIEKIGYKASSKISEGSYGEVYLVYNNKQPYALKILDRNKIKKYQKEHEGFIQGFILKKLNHPGIIKVYQTIHHTNWIFHIMEYCPHGSLFQLIRTINTNPSLAHKKAQIIKYYLSQLLETLDYIHSQGIVHRDFKPQNIVLDKDLRVKMIDFGSAKPISPNYYTAEEQTIIAETRTTNEQFQRKSFVGSPNYISPQGTQCQYSTASDIWAFGIIVYRFYHGHLPFAGENNFIIFRNIKEVQPTINPNLPNTIKQLILGCLKKNPKERPTTKFIKLYSYFKGVYFNKILYQPSPITPNQIQEVQVEKYDIKLQIQVQKMMFFGNFKPRILSMVVKKDRLLMSYSYVQTKVVKNQFQINMSDYAEKKTNEQFYVINDDKRYCFRVKKCSSSELVQEINQIIKKHFQNS